MRRPTRAVPRGYPALTAAALLLGAGASPASSPFPRPCGHPAGGTLPGAARQLCLLASLPSEPAKRRQPRESGQDRLGGSGANHTELVLARAAASARPSRDEAEDPQGGPPNGTRPGVIDIHLSSELQTAQRAGPAAHVARHDGLDARDGLDTALSAVLAAVSLASGGQASAARASLVPVALGLVVSILVCGAFALRNRIGGRVLRGLRPPLGGGKGEAQVPTVQSLAGGSSQPSFGSRPNTAVSSVGLPDNAREVGSSPGSARQAVRFNSAEMLAPRVGPDGARSLSPPAAPPASADMGALRPICPALVLPCTEAHLQIQLSALTEVARAGGELYVLGPLGNRLLRAEVRRTRAAVRTLEIFSVSVSDALAKNTRVVTVTAGEPGATGLLLTGPDGKAYGELVARKGAFAVHCPGLPRPALVLVGDAAGLQLAANAGEDGRHLASCGPSLAPDGAGRLELRVRAGVDIALVLSSILAVVLLS